MRPKGTRHWNNETSADQQAVLLSTYSVPSGVLYTIDISWTGQAAGDRVVLYANTANSGTKLWDFIIPTAVGNFSPQLPAVGIEFEKGIYFNPNVSDPTAGKLKVNLNWDVRS